MNLDNFLVRPHRKLVEHIRHGRPAHTLTTDAADDVAEHLAGLPSPLKDDDEDAKRFDLLILRRQLAQLQGDAVTAERLREQIQDIATALLEQTAIPSVAAQQELLDEVASDQWWIDVTLPMLELARRRLRGLLQFLTKTQKNPVYTSFQDELTDSTDVDLPGFTPGTNWKRFSAKAAAYLKQHPDHIALQRLRRNKALTTDDLQALEQMLIDSGTGDTDDHRPCQRTIPWSRPIHPLSRRLRLPSRTQAFAHYLDGTTFNANQIHFINLIVDELTTNGVWNRTLYDRLHGSTPTGL